ncbi:MAG: response regulator transcription factor [Alphaproteobacteria bacterium]|nr:response regulator transcription factor [Alphaproteobacteria bacterium]
MSEPPHILVVDDDTRLRELLRRYLSENDFIVSVASDAAEARRILSGITFDLLVLDVMMPGEDGLSLTQSIRQDGNTPILLLTARGEVEDRVAGLERGADDYLVKPFEPRELLLRISTILRRSAPTAPNSRVQLGECTFDVDRGELWRHDELVHLTSIEEELLRTLARHAGETVSRNDLIKLSSIDGNARTVDVQVTRLRRKIEPNPRAPRFLHAVRGRGYMLRPN